MGYRVDYQPIKKIRGIEKRKSSTAAYVGICIGLSIIICSMWPNGKQILGKVLFSGDAAVTAEALEELTVDLKEGEQLSDALEAFCKYVIEESGSGEN